MVTFNIPIDLAPKGGPSFQRVIATVGTGSTYTVMPAPLLRMMGVDPEWTGVFETASGEQEERSVAEVRIKLEGRERTTICVFGRADSQPVLGTYALEGLGLAVDEASKRLAPARLRLG